MQYYTTFVYEFKEINFISKPSQVGSYSINPNFQRTIMTWK